MLIIFPYFFFNIFLIANLDIMKVEVKFISITFFQFSSESRIEILSNVIPALLIKTSNPSNFLLAFSMNSSILLCSSSLNFSTKILGYCFFKISNFSSFVPVARTNAPRLINFSTILLPIPPVAPVINTFLFFKFIY